MSRTCFVGRKSKHVLWVVLWAASMALAEGFACHAGSASLILSHARHMRYIQGAGLRSPATPLRSTRPAARQQVRQLAMQTEKTATQQIIVGILAFGFLFGALFPLINNGLRVGTASDMSGAATGMKEKELNERLAKVRQRAPLYRCIASCETLNFVHACIWILSCE
jgi:hypothetical protein